MNDRNIDNLDKRKRLAQDAVRSLPRPGADPDFRAWLKAQFVAGEIPESVCSDTVASDSHGTGAIRRDALRAGARVQVGKGGSVDLVYPGSFAMRLDAGTDMVLPARPGRWFNRTVEAPLEIGEISVRTGPDLAGGGLVVCTGEDRAIIHGTRVSVVRNDAVTCVCLIEGSADMPTDDEIELGAIPPGMRWVLFRDGSEPPLLDIMPAHRDHMLGLDASLKDVFEKP